MWPALVFWLQALLLVGAAFSCLWGLGFLPHRAERRFWRLLAGGLACWLGVHLLEIPIAGAWESHIRLALLGDCGYALLYLCFILAIELRPHAQDGADRHARARTLAAPGAAIFVLGLLLYLPGISATVSREEYLTWIPSFLFYALLDLYLVLRLVSLVSSVSERRWRTIYGLLFATVLLWAFLDSLELLGYLGITGRPEPGSLLLHLWLVPPLLLVAASRLRAGTPAAGPSAPASDDFFQGLWGGPFLANAAVFPLIHLGAYAVSTPAPALETPRVFVVLIAGLLLLGTAFLSQRLLARENARLIAERAEVAERVKLAQRMEAIGRLAGGVAHDFNNLLQVIRVCSENLVASLDPRSHERPQAEEIALAADKAARLTGRLLSYAREQPAYPVVLDLNDAVARTTGMLRRIIGDDIELTTALDPRAGGVCADREQLEGVLLNLCVNARDAMPRGGRLEICTEAVTRAGTGGAPGQHLAALLVRDTGVGMDEATRARVFEPFFTTKKDGRGTGLGLTMIRSFVLASGGEIQIESAPGRGTSVRILLPAAARPAAQPVDPDPPSRLSGSATILVVEDERAVRSVICGLLQEGGFRVLEAADGLEALERLEHLPRPPDLVLSDLIMPRLGGAELAERLGHRYPDLPLVFMTGHAGSELARDGLQAIPVLQKPFSRSELALVLGRVLEARGGTLFPQRAPPSEPGRGSPAAGVSPLGISTRV
jgi:signal transduction histidine kinase/CheY-like chemotaxis protein